MSDEIFAKIGSYYDTLVERYGHDHRACDYGRAESQAIKFDILAQVMPLDGRSVLDVGCGFADFSGFLGGRYRDVRYEGIDLSAEMVREARALHPGLVIRQANLMTDDIGIHDVVFANGIFYLLGEDAWPTMQALIRRMFAGAGLAAAFNSLSSLAAGQEPGEFYADPAEVMAFCLTLTPRVTLRHDYHDRDFTIYMYKPA